MLLLPWGIQLLFILRCRALTIWNISVILTFILNKHLLNIAAWFQIDPEKRIALKTVYSSPTAMLASTSLLIYMALISAIAHALWCILLKHNPASKVAVFGFMNSVFGMILSAVLLKEQNQAFTIQGLISLLPVCIGIYFVNQDFSKKLHNHFRR